MKSRNKISLPTTRSIADHLRRQALPKKRRANRRAKATKKIARRALAVHAMAASGVTRKLGVNLTGKFKANFRTIGGQTFFFRSSWEANYARFLERERVAGRIIAWAHEPKTFYFADAIKPPRSYTPDFCITTLDEMKEYHEVKGVVDRRLSKIVRLMASNYPYYPFKILDPEGYFEMQRIHGAAIEGWEFPDGSKHRIAKYARV